MTPLGLIALATWLHAGAIFFFAVTTAADRPIGRVVAGTIWLCLSILSLATAFAAGLSIN